MRSNFSDISTKKSVILCNKFMRYVTTTHNQVVYIIAHIDWGKVDIYLGFFADPKHLATPAIELILQFQEFPC